MEEISEMEKRILFNKIGELRHVGRELLLKLLMEKFIGSNQSLETYLRSNLIYNQIKNCGDFTGVQKDKMYPKKGATFCIDKFDINLICKLIRKLPLLPSEEPVQGYGKINVNPYVRVVENITTIFEETYDLHHSLVDKNTLEEGSKNLRDIYKLVAKDLSQEEQLKIVQLIDDEVQVPNISSVPDKCKCHSEGEYGTVEDTPENVEIPVQNWRHGQIIPLDVNKMEEYCKSGHLIKEEKFRSFYKWENESSKKKYLIKKLVFTDTDEDKDLKEKYYTELYHETILHPHVVPIIAHAQSSSQYPRVMYLMYPYMENGSVRTNIKLENKGESFSPKANESNSSIWIRCIYQVASALDYLHNIGKHGLRGPVFHRNITSSTIRFNECFNAKLCDFGRAVEAKHNAVEATGIPYFNAPGYHPRMTDTTCYKASYDVYSLCVVILEILTGEVVKDENPFSDLKSDSEYDRLLTKIKTRPEPARKVAKWSRKDLRDPLAQRAREIFRMDETEMAEVKAEDVLKIIKDARIESYKLYIEDTNTENCVSCYINKRATTLPLKGKNCNNCTMFCVHCLTDYHNELICPRHGPTRRPFDKSAVMGQGLFCSDISAWTKTGTIISDTGVIGDHVYGVFVAGNHVEELSDRLTFHGYTPQSAKDIAKIFIRDAKKLANVLTSKFPLVLGARPEHFEVVTPKKPGKEDKMEILIEDAFAKINKMIRDDQQKYQDNSLFIFYFSGHCDLNEETNKCTQQNSNNHFLYLGGKRDTITTERLREMLNYMNCVNNVLIILDCCYASGNDFVSKNDKSRFQIYQLSSCDKRIQSACDPTRGSFFTHFLCQALRGVGSHENEEVHGGDCKKGNKGPCQSFHKTQKVTLNDVETYIQSQYDLLKLKTDVKKHAQNAGIIELAYYKKLHKRSLSIRLEGSEPGEIYTFSEVPDSIDCLRKDIVKYIDEKKIQCQIHEMLTFLNDLYKSSEDEKAPKYVIKDTSRLVAIYQQNEQETKELTCLNDLWKISPSLMSLVAKIRQDVNGLRNGHLKYDRIKKAMIFNWPESFFSKCIGIDQDCLQLNVEDIARILTNIDDMESAKPEEQFHEHKWLLNNLYQLIDKCQREGVFDATEGKILKFRVYKPFSILQFE